MTNVGNQCFDVVPTGHPDTGSITPYLSQTELLDDLLSSWRESDTRRSDSALLQPFSTSNNKWTQDWDNSSSTGLVQNCSNAFPPSSLAFCYNDFHDFVMNKFPHYDFATSLPHGQSSSVPLEDQIQLIPLSKHLPTLQVGKDGVARVEWPHAETCRPTTHPGTEDTGLRPTKNKATPSVLANSVFSNVDYILPAYSQPEQPEHTIQNGYPALWERYSSPIKIPDLKNLSIGDAFCTQQISPSDSIWCRCFSSGNGQCRMA
ncbi:uncharacterized protein ATNIH1004_011640 [Aspergillus tanneri]|uniref:Uncharacterized protein n=1 Tax=Aspergillus tanneri TaxID=1220188 RepID=A0A5M9M836_9EURO|nr:uncharacterized protein ATNIH1004_011640 [Aspergillus tanneri]KAA8641504.1 hypothetical protein ATNIH1004_011640 [Aspergillus tanneri]